MIPIIQIQATEAEIEDMTNLTYALNVNKNVIFGKVDGIQSVRQSIYLILNTERYDYVIYSTNYGIELKDLLGMNTSYVLPELKRRIIEALVQDDRIISVEGFEFEVNRNKVLCKFVVTSIFGTLNIESEVRV